MFHCGKIDFHLYWFADTNPKINTEPKIEFDIIFFILNFHQFLNIFSDEHDFILVLGSFSDIKQMIDPLKFMCVRLSTEFGLNHRDVLFPEKMNHKIRVRRS